MVKTSQINNKSIHKILEPEINIFEGHSLTKDSFKCLLLPQHRNRNLVIY